MANWMVFLLLTAQILSAMTAEMGVKLNVPKGFYLLATKETTNDVEQLRCFNVSTAINFEIAMTPKWTYRVSENSTEFVTLFPKVGESRCTGNECLLERKVGKFYSGYYRCDFSFGIVIGKPNVHVYADFKVTDTPGAELNDLCALDADCMAENARCDANSCICPADHPIPFANSADSPACLKKHCNVDEQCFNDNGSFACMRNRCLCAKTHHLVKTGDGYKCTETVLPFGRCTINENCYTRQSGPTGFCKDGYCQCHKNATLTRNFLLCNASEMIMEKTRCSSAYFKKNGSCNLACRVSVPTWEFDLQGTRWAYKSTPNSTDNVTLPHVESVYESLGKYRTSVTLSNYYGGFYLCQYLFNVEERGRAEMNAAFNFLETKASMINESCTDSSECATLHAQCDYRDDKSTNKTCFCGGDFPIPYNNERDNPACLHYVAKRGACQFDVQCKDLNFTCRDYTCDCLATEVTTKDRLMCVHKAKLFGPCVYPEQCHLSDRYSTCDNGQCKCISGFAFDQATAACQNSRLSADAIVWIALGTFIGAGLLIAAILFIIRWSFRVHWRNEGHEMDPIPQDDNDNVTS